MIWMFDTFPIAVGGVISISNRVLLDLVGGNMSPAASWIVMAVVVVGVRRLLDLPRHTPKGAGPRHPADGPDPFEGGASLPSPA